MAILGSFMIASAEMGNAPGDMDYLIDRVTKQLAFAVLGLVFAFLITVIDVDKIIKFKFRPYVIEFLAWVNYFGILLLLLFALTFEPINGANAWIVIGGMTIQPSEFAKVAIIILAACIFAVDHKENNVKKFWIYTLAVALYTGVILVFQHDTGSAVVLFIMAYCAALLPEYKELATIHKVMLFLVGFAVLIFGFLMTPFANDLLESGVGDYRIARILVANNPFKYRYDQGYHLIMSLVSFAQGGIGGMGWTNSIHKYMNFPNPSSDFILPVMVEELGIGGFIAFVILYCLILLPLIYYSVKIKNPKVKIILFGTFLYFIIHFILNVGGVSGLIPLTGVPILILSSGGSSLFSCLSLIALSQKYIERHNLENENNSR